MLISTRIFNYSNVVIRNFTMEYRIESEDSDSKRDKYVCEYLEEITFTKKPDGIKAIERCRQLKPQVRFVADRVFAV